MSRPFLIGGACRGADERAAPAELSLRPGPRPGTAALRRELQHEDGNGDKDQSGEASSCDGIAPFDSSTRFPAQPARWLRPLQGTSFREGAPSRSLIVGRLPGHEPLGGSFGAPGARA
jgi:hypothetical protein